MKTKASKNVEDNAGLTGDTPPEQKDNPQPAACDALAVSVAEFCRLTSLSRSTAFKLMRSGEIVSAKLGRRRVVTVASIKELIVRNLGSGPKL